MQRRELRELRVHDRGGLQPERRVPGRSALRPVDDFDGRRNGDELLRRAVTHFDVSDVFIWVTSRSAAGRYP